MHCYYHWAKSVTHSENCSITDFSGCENQSPIVKTICSLTNFSGCENQSPGLKTVCSMTDFSGCENQRSPCVKIVALLISVGAKFAIFFYSGCFSAEKQFKSDLILFAVFVLNFGEKIC